jgi:hypothetical protein
MSIRGLVIALLLVGALGLAWQQREPLQAWLGTSASKVQSVAEAATSSSPAGDAAKARPGGLRKCVKGQEISYTNAECPPGYRDLAVTAGSVTVLPATPVPKPEEASSGPSALHKALGVTRDDTLKDKIIERAVEKATR